ncbi:hypothetical protein Pfo_012120, partial [Paulownia fortunei]
SYFDTQLKKAFFFHKSKRTLEFPSSKIYSCFPSPFLLYQQLAMVCLGILFGCRPSSLESYVFSALIIIGVLVCLRLLCYALKLLLRRDDDTHSDRNSNDGNGVEMQSGNRVPRPVNSLHEENIGRELVCNLPGDDQARFGVNLSHFRRQ